ncbi:MAG: hypothetical protein WBO77_02675 [Microgenomates group bacterium]
MDTKQKKQLITISLAGAVLLAGLVAGFLVVQNGVFIQNRASTGAISCRPPQGICRAIKSSGAGYSSYTIVIKVVENGAEQEFKRSGPNADEISFDAVPFKRYICEIVADGNACKSTDAKDAPVCIAPDSGVPTETLKMPTVPPVAPKPSDTPTPTDPARVNIPSTTPTSVIVTTVLSPTPTSKTPTPTTKTATNTPVPPTSGTGGSGITPTGLPTSGPTNAPTATAAVQATRAAATATQAAVQTQASNPSATKAASTTSLPASGNVHPALIFGMLSVFIIVLGLLF